MDPPPRKPVVVITGASKGIGLAVTKILLEELNANVVAISRTKTPELVALVEANKDALLTVECSVTDATGFSQAIALAEKTYQHIDGLILNAAVMEPLGSIETANLAQWKEHFDINFFSLVTALQLTLPALRKSELRGRVVMVSSGAATGATAGFGVYAASKAAMNSLCRTLAQEEPGIISVALRPGMVDTAMQLALREYGADHLKDADYKKFVDAHAEGRLIKPEDSGYVIAQLALIAEPDLSGQFVSWDSELCGEYRRE
ncbi:hypothetical protein JAAARDRAFT_28234 [Jaapia argillacea MUCL 33604]|uniref:Ketoreductase domain-containing protein n=1 Tax=Jaapia argillacea MUCL 33604 TaxID=933084 RepID=A0A067QPM7_9AGAM|nr:hypothetical protein JAAARDRAFT_28234 [Jaapia argillacea MUCL 33604]